jgi:hypothetical protein
MAIKEEPEKYGWWISELNSLGINTEAKDEELTDILALEDLTTVELLCTRTYPEVETPSWIVC